MPISLLAQKPRVKNDPIHDDKPIHFGFSIGLNAMDYKIEHSQEALNDHVYIGIASLTPGINIHAISNLRLMENLDLRALPGISFGERYVYFKSTSPIDTISIGNSLNYKAESSYLELPISFKYKSKRLNNFRPYLLGGANFRYDLAVKGEYHNEEQLFMIDKSDIYAELGYGMDFYLTYFKLGVELKYSFGLNNLIKRMDKNGSPPEEIAKYTDYIDKINSHILVLSIHFE